MFYTNLLVFFYSRNTDDCKWRKKVEGNKGKMLYYPKHGKHEMYKAQGKRDISNNQMRIISRKTWENIHASDMTTINTDDVS